MNEVGFGLFPNKKIKGKLYKVYGVFLEHEVKTANRLAKQIPGAIRRKEDLHQIVYIPVKRHGIKARRNIRAEMNMDEELQKSINAFNMKK